MPKPGRAEASGSCAKPRPAVPNGLSTRASSAFPRYLPELRSRRGHSCRSRARTFGRRRWIAPAAEVSPPSLQGGTGGVEQRRAGHQEVGADNPSRESRGRAALPGPPRGLGRALEERRAAARGGRAARRGPPTSRGCRRPAAVADLCARSHPPSGWLDRFVARIRERCRGLECTSARGRPVLLARAFGGPSSAPRP